MTNVLDTITSEELLRAESVLYERGRVTVVFFREQQAWVAQALELDMAAQGDTIQQAAEYLEVSMLATIAMDLREKRVPFVNVPPAPKKYWPIEPWV